MKWVIAFINTWNLPAGAYQVFIPETGWSSRPYTGLEDTVRELKAHRIANPRFNWPTDDASIRQFVLNYTESRLRAMPGGAGMGWLVPDSPPPDVGFTLPHRAQSPARLVVERTAVAGNPIAEQVKNTLAGIGLWLSWFGDAPVAQELAAHRASVCARCPLNERDGNLLQRFNEATANEISAIFGSLKHARLSTPHDDMLGVCAACDCPMKAKVFSPLSLILKHLRIEARGKLHPDCWIPREEKEAHAASVQSLATEKHSPSPTL